MEFERIKSDGNIKEIIKSAFDTTLSVGGGWGYDKTSATLIEEHEQPIEQLEHLLASMRSYIEMSMTRKEEERYGSINLNEIEREELVDDSRHYHKVTYATTAMKEDLYNAFIEEYKENYGKEDFDLSEYFDRRKKATLSRNEIYWFELPA